MLFHTNDIMDVTNALEDYEVFLAAFVGIDKERRFKNVHHLAKCVASGALLMLRSAHSSHAFLYSVIDPCDFRGFELLAVGHTVDEVINSVIIARKYSAPLQF